MGFSNYEISKNKKSNIWITPEEILKPLGPFDLDPCAAPIPRRWDTAKTMWAESVEDGLKREWSGRVWLNPPYDRRWIEKWMEKMARHGNGVAMVYARSDTNWFQKWVFPFVSGIFFFRGRIRFYRPNGVLAGAAPAPHVLLAYGAENANRLANYSWPGAWVPYSHGNKILTESAPLSVSAHMSK